MAGSATVKGRQPLPRQPDLTVTPTTTDAVATRSPNSIDSAIAESYFRSPGPIRAILILSKDQAAHPNGQDAMNIIKIFQRFPTRESCIAHLEASRWRDGKPTCPYCGSANTARSEHRHRCYNCKTGFSVTAGTNFHRTHRTHLPLQKWFLAITLMLNARKGLSALQLSRDLQVNKNTAWRITMQIRKAMSQAEHRSLLTGIVEMDGTCIGGKPRKGTRGDGPNGSHPRGRGTRKAPVVGAVKRGGKVAAQAVQKDKMKGRHLRAFVRDRVDTERAGLIIDECTGYRGMSKVLPTCA